MTGPTGDSAPKTRQRTLFIAEAANLPHLARPVALAQSLFPAPFWVQLASAPRYASLPGKPRKPHPGAAASIDRRSLPEQP